MGHTERAAAVLARALDVATATGERFYEPEIHRLLGAAALQEGRREEAARHLERGRAVARDLGIAALERRLADMPDA